MDGVVGAKVDLFFLESINIDGDQVKHVVKLVLDDPGLLGNLVFCCQ